MGLVFALGVLGSVSRLQNVWSLPRYGFSFESWGGQFVVGVFMAISKFLYAISLCGMGDLGNIGFLAESGSGA